MNLMRIQKIWNMNSKEATLKTNSMFRRTTYIIIVNYLDKAASQWIVNFNWTQFNCAKCFSPFSSRIKQSAET